LCNIEARGCNSTMKGLITFASLVHGSQSAEIQANPIRKVVNMLQLMQSKIEKEAEKKTGSLRQIYVLL